MDKKYGIALITNNAYVDATIVLMKSFLANNSWYNGDFIIIYDKTYCKLNKASRERLSEVYKNVYFHCVENNIYDKFVEHFYDILTYKRFVVSVFTVESFALKYTPTGEEYDKILYLDVDQIVTGNIQNLFLADKDIICGPGDGFIYNTLDDTLLKRTDENIGGGLFLIDKKYLSVETRNEIIEFAENFPIRSNIYPKWSGSAFEMHVLNAWLLNKDVYIAPSTYQFPSVLYNISRIRTSEIKCIRDELFKYCKIIHIWDEKPWNKKNKNFTMIDLYWNYLYKKYINPDCKISNKSLKTIYASLKDYKNKYLKISGEAFKRIFSFYQLVTTENINQEYNLYY